ncbi:DUF4956 domain-containing protein [Endozoicomonas sp.]|uniref:DUF4956 domain-containing protein n=1 Tax=Endozoicomonas sp. TaxID=1892382 RepID=UPI00288885F7|nr:DUF4956 domain-containing protein [Endozoicomonas sp.]
MLESVDPLLVAYLPKDIRSTFFPYASVGLAALILNLMIGYVLSSLIGIHFRKYSTAFGNRKDFSRLFPLLMLSVVLIITVVKSSLALALGLVGALSIVRFRTPIKEPEELMYLFLNIGIAIALGAGQTFAAMIACAVILILIAISKKRMARSFQEHGLFLSISYTVEENTSRESILTDLKSILTDHVLRMDLSRLDFSNSKVDALFFINIHTAEELDSIIFEVNNKFHQAQISILEQNDISGL